MAIATTFVTYIGYGLIIGAVSVPNASGNETEYNAWRYGNVSDDIPLFTDCSLDTIRFNDNNESMVCEFGSANDQQVFKRMLKNRLCNIKCYSFSADNLIIII